MSKLTIRVAKSRNFNSVQLEMETTVDKADATHKKLDEKADQYLDITAPQQAVNAPTPKREFKPQYQGAAPKQQYNNGGYNKKKPLQGAMTPGQWKVLANKNLSPAEMNAVNDPQTGKEAASQLIDKFKSSGQTNRNQSINQFSQNNNPTNNWNG